MGVQRHLFGNGSDAIRRDNGFGGGLGSGYGVTALTYNESDRSGDREDTSRNRVRERNRERDRERELERDRDKNRDRDKDKDRVTENVKQRDADWMLTQEKSLWTSSKESVLIASRNDGQDTINEQDEGRDITNGNMKIEPGSRVERFLRTTVINSIDHIN